jgi:hypothetical protein
MIHFSDVEYAEKAYAGTIRNKKTGKEYSFRLNTWGDIANIERELAHVYAGNDIERLKKEFYITYDAKGVPV